MIKVGNLFNYEIIYTDVLESIKKYCDLYESAGLKAHRLHIISCLNQKGYSDIDINQAINNLLDVGYLRTRRNNIIITEKGNIFLENYNLKKIEPFFTRFCKFVRRNLAEVFSVIAVIISVIGLFIK
jgi:hypothetical protein